MQKFNNNLILETILRSEELGWLPVTLSSIFLRPPRPAALWHHVPPPRFPLAWLCEVAEATCTLLAHTKTHTWWKLKSAPEVSCGSTFNALMQDPYGQLQTETPLLCTLENLAQMNHPHKENALTAPPSFQTACKWLPPQLRKTFPHRWDVWRDRGASGPCDETDDLFRAPWLANSDGVLVDALKAIVGCWVHQNECSRAQLCVRWESLTRLQTGWEVTHTEPLFSVNNMPLSYGWPKYNFGKTEQPRKHNIESSDEKHVN